MTDLASLANYIHAKLEHYFSIPTAEWPSTVKVDTAGLGPRVMEQQPKGLRLSHGMFCSRLQWYLRNEPEKVTDPSPAMVQLCKFSIGDLWEAYSHAILPECMPDDHEYIEADDMEVELDGIKGHLDGIIILPNGDVVISDSKHTSDFRINKWENGMPDWEWGNRAQAINYMWAFQAWLDDTPKADRPAHLKRARKVVGFVWPASYTQKFGLWGVTCGWAYANDRELMSHGKEAMRQRHDARTRTSPPPRWECKNLCRYCDFNQYCKGDLR
jgi:hypothetical protein